MMAGENEQDDEVLEPGEDAPADQVEQQDDDTQPAAEAPEAIDLPTFGDAAEEQEGDNDLVRKLRGEIRERDKKLRERDEAAKPQPDIVVGEKPTLETCEWDEEKFERELDDWKERKRQVEERANQQTEQQRKSAEAWNATLVTYANKRASYPVEAMNDAETKVADSLSPAQQAIIVSVADNPAKLILALGRNQPKLDAAAEVADPLKFAALVAKLETEIKMPVRKPNVEPDTPQRGSGQLSASNTDKELEKLEKRARETGNRDPVVAYKRKLREAGRKAA